MLARPSISFSASLLVFVGEGIEGLARENKEIDVGEGDGVGRAGVAVEECHLAEEVAAAEAADVVGLTALEREHDAHRPFADQEQFIARIGAREYLFARLDRALVEAQLERREGLFLAPLEQTELVQVEQLLLGALDRNFLEYPILDPFLRGVEFVEDPCRALVRRQAHLVDVLLHVASGGQIVRQIWRTRESHPFRPSCRESAPAYAQPSHRSSARGVMSSRMYLRALISGSRLVYS